MANQRDIARETNVRFWIQTAYKPGVALDPADPADRQMTRAWLNIYRDLVQQNARGTLSLTHKHESLARRLQDAVDAYRIESTSREGEPAWVDARRMKHEALNDVALWQEMLHGQRIA